VVWLVNGDWYENPVMTFPIKDEINTELFIDRVVALCIGETWIRVVTDEGDPTVVPVYLAQKCYLDLKGVGMKGQVATYLGMSLMGKVIKIEH